MSSRARTKVLHKMLGDGNEHINEMFEEMLGLKHADPDIIRPKFVQVRNELRIVYKIFKQLATFQSLRDDFPELAQGMREIMTYADELKTEQHFNEDETDTEEKFKNADRDQMNKLYKTIKTSKHIKQLIALCGRLKQYHKNFENLEQLKYNFVGQEPGLSFCIFPFSTFDLKLLWASPNIKPVVKKYVLTVLHKLYDSLFKIYKTVTSADVDIDRFTTVIMSSIAEIKKQPELHRCKNAFNKIEQSVHLLQKNFDQYYRDSISSENMCVILENFICDVSAQGDNNPRLILEFRIITRYMEKMSQQSGRSNDPQLQKMFRTLQMQFNAVDKYTENEDLDKDFEDNTMEKQLALLNGATNTKKN